MEARQLFQPAEPERATAGSSEFVRSGNRAAGVEASIAVRTARRPDHGHCVRMCQRITDESLGDSSGRNAPATIRVPLVDPRGAGPEYFCWTEPTPRPLFPPRRKKSVGAGESGVGRGRNSFRYFQALSAFSVAARSEANWRCENSNSGISS